MRVRCDWDHVDAEETEILEAMEQGLRGYRQPCTTYLLPDLQDTLSNAFE